MSGFGAGVLILSVTAVSGVLFGMGIWRGRLRLSLVGVAVAAALVTLAAAGWLRP